MPFHSIRRILPSAIRGAGIERQVTAVQVVQEAQAALVRLWGEEKAAYVQAQSFHEGVLKMKALAPAALQELKMIAPRLKNEINRGLGSHTVKDMRCQEAFL
jgi:hypothetical protein